MTSPRSTAAYRSWVKQVLAKCEPTCIRCGYPVDMDLPRTHPQGASADHEPPLAETGDLTPGLDGSGIAHLQCNRSHGGRLGSARAQANQGKREPKQTKKQTQTRPNDSLDTTLTTENAGIELPSGDRWLVHAANDSAGVGYSVSMLFVDEAWKVKRGSRRRRH
jgi:hypothetical protein